MRGFAKNLSFHEKDLSPSSSNLHLSHCYVSSYQLFVSIFFKFSASSKRPTQVFYSIRITATTVKNNISSLSVNSFPSQSLRLALCTTDPLRRSPPKIPRYRPTHKGQKWTPSTTTKSYISTTTLRSKKGYRLLSRQSQTTMTGLEPVLPKEIAF